MTRASQTMLQTKPNGVYISQSGCKRAISEYCLSSVTSEDDLVSVADLCMEESHPVLLSTFSHLPVNNS